METSLPGTWTVSEQRRDGSHRLPQSFSFEATQVAFFHWTEEDACWLLSSTWWLHNPLAGRGCHNAKVWAWHQWAGSRILLEGGVEKTLNNSLPECRQASPSRSCRASLRPLCFILPGLLCCLSSGLGHHHQGMELPSFPQCWAAEEGRVLGPTRVGWGDDRGCWESPNPRIWQYWWQFPMWGL